MTENPHLRKAPRALPPTRWVIIETQVYHIHMITLHLAQDRVPFIQLQLGQTLAGTPTTEHGRSLPPYSALEPRYPGSEKQARDRPLALIPGSPFQCLEFKLGGCRTSGVRIVIISTNSLRGERRRLTLWLQSRRCTPPSRQTASRPEKCVTPKYVALPRECSTTSGSIKEVSIFPFTARQLWWRSRCPECGHRP